MDDLHTLTCAIEIMTPYIMSYYFHKELIAVKLGLKRNNGRTISPTDFYSYCLQVWESVFNIIMRARQLTQQYAIDAQAKIEYSRLTWARNHQTTIRAEKYQGLHDTVSQGDGVNAGRRTFLPPTITVSPYYFNECFQNSC